MARVHYFTVILLSMMASPSALAGGGDKMSMVDGVVTCQDDCPDITKAVEEAEAAYEAGLWKSGIKLVESAIGSIGRVPDLLFVNGKLHLQKAQHVGLFKRLGAAKHGHHLLEEAVLRDPDNSDAIIWLARFHANAPGIAGGNEQCARNLVERLRQIDPAQAERLRGDLLYHEKDYDAAADHFQAALKLREDNAILLAAARNDVARKAWAIAADRVDQVLASDPYSRAALALKVEISAVSGGDLLGGVEAAEQLLALGGFAKGEDRRGDTYLHLARIHEQLGALEEARKAYKAALDFKASRMAAEAGLDGLPTA